MADGDHDRIIRLEERINRADMALQLQARETERRLEQLNHAYEQGRQRDADFLPREVYDSQHSLILAAIADNRDKVTTLLATGIGSNRTTSVFLSVFAVLVSAAAAVATVVYFATH